MPLHERTYNCAECGFQADRDFNAAVNERKLCLGVCAVLTDFKPALEDKLQTAGAGYMRKTGCRGEWPFAPTNGHSPRQSSCNSRMGKFG